MKILACKISIVLIATFLASSPLSAQADDPTGRAPLAARIDLGSGQIVKLTRTSLRFQRISINPNQVIGIAMKFPSAMAGQSIVVEGVDGGTVRTDSTIDSNGVLTIGYASNNVVGNARLSLYDGENTHLLQFWVRDLQHPDRNPPTAVAGN